MEWSSVFQDNQKQELDLILLFGQELAVVINQGDYSLQCHWSRTTQIIYRLVSWKDSFSCLVSGLISRTSSSRPNILGDSLVFMEIKGESIILCWNLHWLSSVLFTWSSGSLSPVWPPWRSFLKIGPWCHKKTRAIRFSDRYQSWWPHFSNVALEITAYWIWFRWGASSE